MRCPFHLSVDMVIIERKPVKAHRRGPGDVESEQRQAMGICPVSHCPWVVEIPTPRTVRLTKANRIAVHVA